MKKTNRYFKKTIKQNRSNLVRGKLPKLKANTIPSKHKVKPIAETLKFLLNWFFGIISFNSLKHFFIILSP